jgi:hypothetical protein
MAALSTVPGTVKNANQAGSLTFLTVPGTHPDR